MNGLKTPMPMIEVTSTLAKQIFNDIQALIERISGIKLQARDQELLIRHLKSLAAESGQIDLEKYAAALPHNHKELQRLIELITTHETSFYREQVQFDFLIDWLAQKKPGSRLNIWSGACSTGEEAFSIGMVLAEANNISRWEILGTDISSKVVKLAAHGVYPKREASSIPPAQYRKYCVAGVGPFAGFFAFNETLSKNITFREMNLTRDAYPVNKFDVIFLRNVLIYFDTTLREHVIKNMVRALTPGGILLISRSEAIQHQQFGLKKLGSSIYEKID